jgi:hypothetical protein
MRNIKFLLATVALIGLAACEESTTTIEANKQNQLLTEANNTIGMPAIINFQEKKILKDIIEMRDRANIRTYAYTQALDGKLVKLCDSVGYGIPYATQYTNPERRVTGYDTTLPQADPNGLYSPSSADGTWVLCKDPASDKVAPVLVEPRLVVSQFPLTSK